ncbi:MAG: hypothetical protein RJA83_1218 [Pseudomonadota bacterium]|jgi:hypothetical protein
MFSHTNKEVIMKLLSYSTWSLFFMTILRVVSRYTCPGNVCGNETVVEDHLMKCQFQLKTR